MYWVNKKPLFHLGWEKKKKKKKEKIIANFFG
jgi:hypothetical protein